VPKGYTQRGRVKDEGWVREAREPQPTDAPPGSPEKIRDLAERARRREGLFSRRDADGEGRKRRTAVDEKNNHISITGSEIDDRAGKKSTGVDQAFGPRLARLRQARGWSRKQLARRARVTLQCVSYLEAGRSKPSLTVAVSLADAFGLTLDEMVGRHFRAPLADSALA
jgi:ribosome-binding protein aMBF1 (putative translation factor)